MSKQFTAVAVLDLVNRKRLDLKDPLSKFFKGFPRYADDITVEELIHHTSALPEYVDIYVASRRAEKDWYNVAMAKADEWYPRMPARKKGNYEQGSAEMDRDTDTPAPPAGH